MVSVVQPGSTTADCVVLPPAVALGCHCFPTAPRAPDVFEPVVPQVPLAPGACRAPQAFPNVVLFTLQVALPLKCTL